ncbi:MAG: FeoA family protein [Bacteriovoracaceae bacterium]
MKPKFEGENMSLWQLNKNQKAEIIGFSKGLDTKFQKRLNDMGIFQNGQISCFLSTPFKGPKLYTIEGTVLSLTSELASLIQVKPLN